MEVFVVNFRTLVGSVINTTPESHAIGTLRERPPQISLPVVAFLNGLLEITAVMSAAMGTVATTRRIATETIAPTA